MAKRIAADIFLTEEELGKIAETRAKYGLCETLDKRCHIMQICNSNVGKRLSRGEIAELAGVSPSTVTITLKRYNFGGIDKVLKMNRSEASDVSRLIADGRTKAEVIALACSSPPSGQKAWTLRLLARKVQVVYEKNLSPSTIQRILSEAHLKPHLNDYWCLPNPLDADFVAHMEDVLDVYELPYNPNIPMVCIDEKSYQLLGNIRTPKPMIPGHNQILDSEYVRNGTACMFMICEPYAGFRHVIVSTSRTAIDFAYVLKHVSDKMYPDREKIILVCDNLNTHDISSLYKAFSPAEANRLRRRFEIHYTPKHGSWLDMAEIELNALTRQCLDRRIEDIEKLVSEVAAWEHDRNEEGVVINWTFTSEKARVKLHSLYPVIENPDDEYDFLAPKKLLPEGDVIPAIGDDKAEPDAKPDTVPDLASDIAAASASDATPDDSVAIPA